VSKANQVREEVLKAARQVDGDDALCVAGITLVSLGLAFVFWPAALMVAGIAVTLLGVMRARA
jgi:hypothetical protein